MPQALHTSEAPGPGLSELQSLRQVGKLAPAQEVCGCTPVLLVGVPEGPIRLPLWNQVPTTILYIHIYVYMYIYIYAYMVFGS